MIDYQTYHQIRSLHQQGMTAGQIAAELRLDERTVRGWMEEEKYEPRQSSKRPSKLDSHRQEIGRLLHAHSFTAQQIFHRIKETGYTGGYGILKEFVRMVRPPKQEAFLTLTFAAGECAQVDWGCAGSLPVGNTHRRLSFFAMVLCYSRRLYVEFTLTERLEQFLACHQNAFNYFGGVPERVMVDNLKSAVLSHPSGQPAQYNPRYLLQGLRRRLDKQGHCADSSAECCWHCAFAVELGWGIMDSAQKATVGTIETKTEFGRRMS